MKLCFKKIAGWCLLPIILQCVVLKTEIAAEGSKVDTAKAKKLLEWDSSIEKHKVNNI